MIEYIFAVVIILCAIFMSVGMYSNAYCKKKEDEVKDMEDLDSGNIE